jgi:hypothetical protein
MRNVRVCNHIKGGERGVTLVETAAALCLLGLLVSLSYPAIKTAVQSQQIVSKSDALSSATYRAWQAVHEAEKKAGWLAGVRTRPFWKNAEHLPAELRSYFEKKNVLSRPAAESAILGFLHMGPLSTFEVVQNETYGSLASGRTMLFCSTVLDQKLRMRSVKAWLGFGTTHALVLRGELRRITSRSPDCAAGLFRGALRADFELRDLVRPAASHETLFAVLPIEDLFFLYLDRGGNLRHVSLLTTESQPIVRNLSGFRYSGQIDAGIGLGQIEITARDGERAESLRLPIGENQFETLGGVLDAAL